MMTLMGRIAVITGLLLGVSITWGAETQRVYLSGKGKDDPVKWDFFCTAGQHANAWSTIGVPSNWELQGFGIFSYGRDNNRAGWPKVQGRYKRNFSVPAEWEKLKVNLVFEGVMTDTTVLVNGQPAGAMHQGGYFRFKYDVSKLLKYGGGVRGEGGGVRNDGGGEGASANLLEVTVDDESANASVNSAERRGDYWNYAGIYRPVYLEAMPTESIERVAIDAKGDGTLTADAVVNGFPHIVKHLESWTLEGQVLDMKGNAVGGMFVQPYSADAADSLIHLTAKIADVKAWNAEAPTLYQLELRLKEGGAVIHSMRQTFGFRTIEVRDAGQGAAGEAAGLFVNRQRIMLKGCDRHSFWPDSGRCLSEQVSRDDIALMKEMNMNAVRMSHYPPDAHFLDACDEMGMYVLDELPGWHAKYDTPTGHRLVQEMVTRDVDHPSILFWDNGNESGWNNDLNDDFAKWDPQGRHVLHPWEFFRGVDTKHYPDYNTLVQKCAGDNVFFPTEMLHGLYDGGAGAGLEDYWKVMMQSKVSAGGIIWAFLDEDVKRVDQRGQLDSKGNQAPDGIVGPYREREGSFYTIKQIWSPIVVTRPAEGGDTLTVENRYSFTNARDCTFKWEWRWFKNPAEAGAGYVVTLKGDALVEGGANGWGIPPGATGKLRLQMPEMGKTPPHDVLALTVKDPSGRELWTWVWPEGAMRSYASVVTSGNPVKVTALDATGAESVTVSVGELVLKFNKKTGELAEVSRAGKAFSLVNGPRLVTGNAALTGLTENADGDDVVVTATYTGDMSRVTYRVRPVGWVTIDWTYALAEAHDFFGVGFDYPEGNVKGMRYLGNGPATVYQNRLAGGTLDVWEKKYNDTMVGDPDNLEPGQHFDYPIFKGYYAGVRWLQLQTTEGPITAVLNQDDLFVQVLTPRTPPTGQIGKAGVAFPNAGISFLHAIPPIGSKFTGPGPTGPMGQKAVAKGEYKGSVSLYFGELGK